MPEMIWLKREASRSVSSAELRRVMDPLFHLNLKREPPSAPGSGWNIEHSRGENERPAARFRRALGSSSLNRRPAHPQAQSPISAPLETSFGQTKSCGAERHTARASLAAHVALRRMWSMNGELIPNIQAGHLPVGILPVPPDAPDPHEVDRSRSDTLFEVKDLESADRLWPRVFPGL
jgi:hypothetical protein